TGGSGQYAKIDYTIEPLEPGSGFIFESAVIGGRIPKEFIPSVEKGFQVSLDKGPLIGFPILDFKMTLTDGAFHAVDSSQMAFETASKAAFRQTMPKAGPQLLEPIMKVDVYVPDANVGDVIGDLNRRRGMIKDQQAGPMTVRIKAEVPLAEMFGYIGDLRSSTSGRGQFSMEFSHYSPVPTNVLEQVKEEVAKRKEQRK
ncbi:MAG: elongation factor G, partial [Myxococcales bacterium]|nr:elongation factor G [Myxococcales bacterium]